MILILVIGSIEQIHPRGGGGGGGRGGGGFHGGGSRGFGGRGGGFGGRGGGRSFSRGGGARTHTVSRSAHSRSAARSGSRSSHAARASHAGRTGRGGGRGGRGYGRGGWGWGLGWGLFGAALLLGWEGGWLGGYYYPYVLPQEYIDEYYEGDYPYWGYGLGYGEELVPLAQNGQWSDIETKLSSKLDDLMDQLAELQKDKVGNAQKISELEKQIIKVQLHLAAVESRFEHEAKQNKGAQIRKATASSEEQPFHQKVAEQESFNKSRPQPASKMQRLQQRRLTQPSSAQVSVQ